MFLKTILLQHHVVFLKKPQNKKLTLKTDWEPLIWLSWSLLFLLHSHVLFYVNLFCHFLYFAFLTLLPRVCAFLLFSLSLGCWGQHNCIFVHKLLHFKHNTVADETNLLSVGCLFSPSPCPVANERLADCFLKHLPFASSVLRLFSPLYIVLFHISQPRQHS